MNNNINEMYLKLGINENVLDFCNDIEDSLKERFNEFDLIAEYNQLKVIKAMQQENVSEACLSSASTGYGYNDLGRDTLEKEELDKDIDIVSKVKNLLDTIQKDMFNRALDRREKLTFEAHNYEELKNIINTQPGFIHGMWCGREECELKIKELNGCKSRCIVPEEPIDDKCVCCGEEAKYHVIWGIQY